MAAWHGRPILTFLTILFIPSSLTFLTLVIHRIRASHAAQRERAPEDVVRNLPWRVWTGSGWEKHEGVAPDRQDQSQSTASTPSTPLDIDIELGRSSITKPTTSTHLDEEEDPAWFNTQVECAICLDEFVKGDRVRVLPCKHIFHLDEVDEWLIQLKKLVRHMTMKGYLAFVRRRRLTPHTVPYLQGRCDTPTASRSSRTQQRFFPRTRSCLRLLAFTTLHSFGANSVTSRCYWSRGESRVMMPNFQNPCTNGYCTLMLGSYFCEVNH